MLVCFCDQLRTEISICLVYIQWTYISLWLVDHNERLLGCQLGKREMESQWQTFKHKFLQLYIEFQWSVYFKSPPCNSSLKYRVLWYVFVPLEFNNIPPRRQTHSSLRIRLKYKYAMLFVSYHHSNMIYLITFLPYSDRVIKRCTLAMKWLSWKSKMSPFLQLLVK